MAELPRRVIREHEFERELSHLLPLRSAREADEFVEAAEFVLARDPEIGLRISDGSSVWALPMAPLRGEQITLFYTFDESTVRLLSIQAI